MVKLLILKYNLFRFQRVNYARVKHKMKEEQKAAGIIDNDMQVTQV